MGTKASQITSLTIVYSTVYSDADQRKHQSSASLSFVCGEFTGEFLAQMASNAENVSIWWRDHVVMHYVSYIHNICLKHRHAHVSHSILIPKTIMIVYAAHYYPSLQHLLMYHMMHYYIRHHDTAVNDTMTMRWIMTSNHHLIRSARSHILKHWWLIFSWTERNKIWWNLKKISAYIIYLQENVAFKSPSVCGCFHVLMKTL